MSLWCILAVSPSLSIDEGHTYLVPSFPMEVVGAVWILALGWHRCLTQQLFPTSLKEEAASLVETPHSLHPLHKSDSRVLQHQSTRAILSTWTNETYPQHSKWDNITVFTAYQKIPNHLINMPQLWHRDTKIRELFNLQLYSSFSCFAHNFHKTDSFTSTFFFISKQTDTISVTYQLSKSNKLHFYWHRPPFNWLWYECLRLLYATAHTQSTSSLDPKPCTKAAFRITGKKSAAASETEDTLPQ